MSKKSVKQSLLNRVFKGTQPNSTKVDLKAPVPRTRDEINKFYQEICVQIGDKSVKSEGLKAELAQLYKIVEGLGNELAAREKLDQEASKAIAETKSESTPTATTDVLAKGNEVPA